MSSTSHFCSPLRGNPPHRRQLFAEDNKLVQETRAEETPRLCQFPSVTPSRTPTSLLLPAIPRTPLSSKRSSKTVLFVTPEDSARSFDILCYLPPEVATQILSYLHPRDLCQVCLVSCGWYRLAQDHVLRERRQLHVQSCRDEYLQSKENFSPFVNTPRRPEMTPASTPLAPVQLRSTQRRSISDSPLSSALAWSRRGSLFESPLRPASSVQGSPRVIQPSAQYSSGNESPLGRMKRKLSDQLENLTEPMRRLWKGCSVAEPVLAQSPECQWGNQQNSPLVPTFECSDSVNRLSSFHTIQPRRGLTDSVEDAEPPFVLDSVDETVEEDETNGGQQWKPCSRSDPVSIKPSLWSNNRSSVVAPDSPVTQPQSSQRGNMPESTVFASNTIQPARRKRLASTPDARQRSSTPPIITQHSVLHRQSSMPTIPSPACLEHTPDRLFLVEEVRRLSISEETDTEVRRQLFPNGMSSAVDSLGRTHSPVLCLHQPETLVGRKANRSRLRRL